MHLKLGGSDISKVTDDAERSGCPNLSKFGSCSRQYKKHFSRWFWPIVN